MKKFLPLCAIYLFTLGIARADVVIEQKMESSFMNGNMVMKVKGERARMVVPSPAGETIVIMDMKAGTTATLLPAQKMMVKMSMAQAKAAAEVQGKEGGVDFTKMKPTATGAKEKVGEWNCDIYTMEMGNNMSSKMWVAKDYPNYKTIMASMNKINASAAAGMGMNQGQFDLGGMTVKTEVNTPLGKVTSTLVSAKELPVADTEFDIPADYKEVELPK